MSFLTRIGSCNNCGECCYLWSNLLKRFHWCEYYSFTRIGGHCLIHNDKEHFPKDCREYPKTPDDLARVNKVCPIRFIDERGRIVDSWMNPKVKLTPIKQS
jgi:hypothetical protein